MTVMNSNVFPNLRDKLKQIYLPSSLVTLSDRAFENLRALELVDISAATGLKTIGIRAFYYTNLKSTVENPFVMPEGLERIGDSAFRFTAVSYIKLPSTLKRIDAYAFGKCENLATFDFNDAAISQGGDFIFRDSVKLENVDGYKNMVVIPKGMFASTGIKSFNFSICNNLTTIGESAFEGTDIRIVELTESIRIIGDYAFASVPVETLIMQNGIQEIGIRAFSFSRLATISLPASVKTIKDGAFYNMFLTTLEINAAEAFNIGVNPFRFVAGGSIFLTNSAVAITKDDFLAFANWENYELNFRDGVSIENDWRFELNATKTEATILAYLGNNPLVITPETLKVDGIPYPVTTLASSSFYANKIIRTVILHEGLLTIDAFAFRDSTIERIYVSNSVTAIGYGAFYESYNMKSYEYIDAVNSQMIANYGFMLTNGFSGNDYSTNDQQFLMELLEVGNKEPEFRYRYYAIGVKVFKVDPSHPLFKTESLTYDENDNLLDGTNGKENYQSLITKPNILHSLAFTTDDSSRKDENGENIRPYNIKFIENASKGGGLYTNIILDTASYTGAYTYRTKVNNLILPDNFNSTGAWSVIDHIFIRDLWFNDYDNFDQSLRKRNPGNSAMNGFPGVLDGQIIFQPSSSTTLYHNFREAIVTLPSTIANTANFGYGCATRIQQNDYILQHLILTQSFSAAADNLNHESMYMTPYRNLESVSFGRKGDYIGLNVDYDDGVIYTAHLPTAGVHTKLGYRNQITGTTTNGGSENYVINDGVWAISQIDWSKKKEIVFPASFEEFKDSHGGDQLEYLKFNENNTLIFYSTVPPYLSRRISDNNPTTKLYEQVFGNVQAIYVPDSALGAYKNHDLWGILGPKIKPLSVYKDINDLDSDFSHYSDTHHLELKGNASAHFNKDGINLSNPNAVSGYTMKIEAGRSDRMILDFIGDNNSKGKYSAITWSISTNAIGATINASSGVITTLPNNTGTVTVTATAGGKSVSCVVTITSYAPTSVELSASAIEIGNGTTQTVAAVTAKVKSNDAPASSGLATSQEVVWSSLNTGIATVDASGLVRGVAVGSTKIRATAKDTGIYSEYTVNITNNAPVTQISVATCGRAYTWTANSGTTLSCVATATPATASNKTITYSSSNTSVASINSSGVLTAGNPGVTVLTFEASNGFKATSILWVIHPVSSVTINTASPTIQVGQELQLAHTISPASAVNKAVRYTSSNEQIVSVTGNGLLRGIGSGSATITVTTVDSVRTSSITVNVTNQNITGNLNAIAPVNVKVGERVKLSQILTGYHNSTFTWVANNDNVKVYEDGTIFGLKEGNSVITVTAKSNSGKTQTINITVSK